MVFEAKLAIMIVRHLTVINREQRTLSKKHDPTIHRVILKKSMHPIYAPMYALNVRVMISEAVDIRNEGVTTPGRVTHLDVVHVTGCLVVARLVAAN